MSQQKLFATKGKRKIGSKWGKKGVAAAVKKAAAKKRGRVHVSSYTRAYPGKAK